MLYMVFDVESIGLHGEGFAVAYVVIDEKGQRVAIDVCACSSDKAVGTPEDREWVNNNIPYIPFNAVGPTEVRSWFWNAWQRWKKLGAVLVTDCGWPVEHRFLAACVDDDPSRCWEGPYPLYDVASIMLANGKDPLAERERLEDEKELHNPLCDVYQSARLLAEMVCKNSQQNELNIYLETVSLRKGYKK